MKLHKNNNLLEEENQQLYCEKCSKFLADRFVEGTCPFCAYNDARGDQVSNAHGHNSLPLFVTKKVQMMIWFYIVTTTDLQ